jgi:3-methyladenine DNA glycosylase AlkD
MDYKPMVRPSQLPEVIYRIQAELAKLSTPEKREKTLRFFKTNTGSYGEHDKFMGTTVPEIRALSKKYEDLTLSDLAAALNSEFNDMRLFALMVLRIQYKKAKFERQKELTKFYIQHIDSVNNWNLVDLSAPAILGDFVSQTDPRILFDLSKSENMWHNRIAIVASFALIRKNQYDVTLQLAESFLAEPHDLLQKATGWMLREVGKREIKTLISFLDKFATKMPKIMLRYSVERLCLEQKQKYTKKIKNLFA